MKKLLLILLCLPMIGFGQVCNSAFFDLDEGITAEYPLISGQPVPLDFPGEFTIEFWINTTHALQNSPIILYKDSEHFPSSTQQYGLLELHLDYNGFMEFRAYKYGFTHTPLISLNPVNDGVWHHIAVLRDNTDQMYMYEDGVLVSQEQGCNGTVCEGPNPLMIGRSNSNGVTTQNALSGNLDNLRIWNRALSLSEIQQYMNQCVINDTDLLLYYDFDVIVNNEFEDQTGTYDGTIINITLDSLVPLCCDCQISNPDTAICPGDIVTITTQSTLNPLWDNGDSTSTLVVSAYTDTTITLYFLDNNNNVICSDDISITINQTTAPTIQQVGNNLMSSNGQSYQWYLNGVMLSGETGQLLNILGDGEYHVEVTDQNGCSTMSEMFDLTISSSIDIESDIKVINKYDIYGRRLNQAQNNSIILYHFENGTVEKRIVIE